MEKETKEKFRELCYKLLFESISEKETDDIYSELAKISPIDDIITSNILFWSEPVEGSYPRWRDDNTIFIQYIIDTIFDYEKHKHKIDWNDIVKEQYE